MADCAAEPPRSIPQVTGPIASASPSQLDHKPASTSTATSASSVPKLSLKASNAANSAGSFLALLGFGLDRDLEIGEVSQ